MKMQEAARAAALALAGLAGNSVDAATIDLTGLGYVQYGDALSYSLPLANYQFGFKTNNGPYAIDSTPGAIQDLVVIGTGSEGNPVTTNLAGMDDAYSTPEGRSGTSFFYPSPVTYRGTEGFVANNDPNTWDTSLASLQSFLSGDQLVVFFNNNQVNSGDTSLQSLAAWARIWITDPDGNVLDGSTFELTNDGGRYALVTEGGGGIFLGDPSAFTASGEGPGDPTHVSGDSTDFVLAGGQLCVATGGSLAAPVPVPCDSDPAAVGGTEISDPIDHNLGADHAAYAILFPELNALLASLFAADLDLTSYTLHADVRLGCAFKTVNGTGTGFTDDPYGPSFVAPCDAVNGWGTALNSGFEQFFLGTALVALPPGPLAVPEPGTLALMGAACLVAFAFSRRTPRR